MYANVLDEALGKPWEWVGALLCGLTGRSNFYFARLFAVVSITPPACYTLITYDVPTSLILVLFVGLIHWFFFFRNTFRFIEWMEGEDIEAMHAGYTEVVFFRLLCPLMFTAMLSVGAWEWAITILAYMGAQYLATQNRPRRDSAFKRAWNWLKAHRPQFHAPVPSPTPA